jgi:predicted O-methyltransferase YrrM
MKKNIVWWPAVVNDAHKDKYGGYDYFEYSRKTWEYWCKKNDVLFIPFTEPVEKDLFKYRINWQKIIFLFDELERMNVDYDQIALVDSSFMIRWDTPNFFEMTDRKFTACRDMDNMRWIYDSIQGYKDIFDGFELDQSKYVNSGFMVFNEEHKEMIQGFKSFYLDNIDEFIDLQDNKVKKGNEQTPLNYWLQKNKVDVNIDLPLPFKLTHLQRKQLFNYNWQLNEDKTPFVIKYGYNFSFNGIEKNKRTSIMRQIWDMIKHNYNEEEIEINQVLDTMPHKDTAKYTTSRQFKMDIFKFFSDKKYKDLSMLELGSCQGNSTLVYSNVFKKVYGVEKDSGNIEESKRKCKERTNVEFIQKDIYTEEWDFPQVDVVMIDAGHTYENLVHDIEKTNSYFNNPIIVIDDYGNPNLGVRKAIDEMIEKGTIKLSELVGEQKGFLTAAGWSMNDREGGIFNL